MAYRILFFLFIVHTASSCTTRKLPIIPVSINKTVIESEVADTAEVRRTGLMNRTSLGEFQGMLFVFEKEQQLSFWMKDTTIPLSIAYISKSKVIQEIYDMEPLSQKSIQSRHSVLYALEVNQGFFEAHNIQKGDKVVFDY